MTDAIHLRFERKPIHFAEIQAFAPLSLGDLLAGTIEGLTAEFVDALTARLTIALSPGSYDVPLSEGDPMRIEIPEGCELSLLLRVARPASEQPPIIQELNGTFSTPIVFKNILTTLEEVQTLFDDHRFNDRLSELMAPLRDQPRISDAVERVSQLGAMLKRKGQLAIARLRDYQDRIEGATEGIALSSFRGRPAYRSDQWRLVFAFTGNVALSNAVQVPFKSVRLLPSILPPLSADLDTFFFDGPLATADLLQDRLQSEAVSRIAADMLDTMAGAFAFKGRTPAVTSTAATLDRGVVTTHVSLPEQLEVSGSFTGARDDDRILTEIKDLNVRLGTGHLKMQAGVAIEPETLLQLAWGDGDDDASRFGFVFPQPDMVPEAAAVVHLEVETLRPIPDVKLEIHAAGPIALGETQATLSLGETVVAGALELAFDARDRGVVPLSMDLTASGRLDVAPGATVDVARATWILNDVSAAFSASVRWGLGEPLRLVVDGDAEALLRGQIPVPALPELHIEDGPITLSTGVGAEFRAHVDVSHRDDGTLVASFDETTATVRTRPFELIQGTRILAIPAQTVYTHVPTAHLAVTGLGTLVTRVSTRSGGVPVLTHEDVSVALFPEDLLGLDLEVRISPAGQLSVSRGTCVPGAPNAELTDAHERLVEAMFDPLKDVDLWFEQLRDEDTWARLHTALSLFSEEAADLGLIARKVALRVWDVMETEGLKEPKDVLPRDQLARTLSLVIVGDTSEVPTLTEIVARVTDAGGLDRAAVESLVARQFPDHAYSYELDRALRWLDDTLSPMLDLEPPRNVPSVPLCERDAFAAYVEPILSGQDLYRLLAGSGPLNLAASHQIGRMAPYLTVEQLHHVLDHPDHLDRADFARVRYVAALKERIALVREGYGGPGYAPQPYAIGLFLGAVTDDDLHRGERDADTHLISDGLLGPMDVAALLQAGLATGVWSRIVQVNQRLLHEYLSRRSRLFVLGTLAEMGDGSPRLLASVLLGFLNQSQTLVRDPLDMPTWLGEAIGTEIPRREDYMAGGRWAKESYFQALMGTAEWIIQEATPYFAVRMHVRVARATPAVPPASQSAKQLAERAKSAILSADELAKTCGFAPRKKGPHARSRRLYERAFAACRRYIEAYPSGFQAPWLKAFWARNHEALVVRSVLRNYQDDVDDVRHWLHVRAGKRRFGDEQALLKAVVEVLYHDPADHERLLADPLVRLLIDPPAGHYDFTIVSGMGVITEGAQGKELEAAFARLQRDRGVRVVRADTGTAKTFAYNAERVVTAIRATEGPYGLLGYSQGCANVLAAESLLRGGTPDQQALLDRLVSRNFLFSALNGSAHGSGSTVKFMDAMIAGERFLKHYQGIFSAIAIRLAQDVISQTMDTRIFAHTIGSVDSISWEGAAAFARDSQFKDGVPTSTVRGIVTPAIMPEALEFLSHTLDRQVEGKPHDTQVTIDEAVGHSVWVDNPHTDVLKRCDMGSLVQTTHHWSPLWDATAFVRTARDEELAIYAFPKDRHVFPWIEVNARFGVIPVIPVEA